MRSLGSFYQPVSLGAPGSNESSRPSGSAPTETAVMSMASVSGRSRTMSMAAGGTWQDALLHLSWAHVAQCLAVLGLLAAAAALRAERAADTGISSGGSALRLTVMVRPGLKSPVVHSKTNELPGEKGIKGGGFKEGPSFWCFALMIPYGYEPALLAAQLGRGVGIFACNEYAVFSNDSFTVNSTTQEPPLGKRGHSDNDPVEGFEGASLMTLPMGGHLHVEFGGKWQTAMNTDIFIRTWAAVIKLGRYRKHPWTVKADPDAVFFPARLRQMVVDEPSGAIYLNNCKFGLHGPIEVLSREAVEAYRNRKTRCDGLRDNAMDMSGPQDNLDKAFGEDEFLHRCLAKIGVRRVDELELLLSETACQQESVPCDEGKVAYHPFKTIQEHFDCWGLASVSATAWAEAVAAAPMPVFAKAHEEEH